MSPNMLVEKESLLYNFESLVAEFGGTLGLFVGFSFMAFWDCLEFVLTMFGNFTILKKRNKSQYKYV